MYVPREQLIPFHMRDKRWACLVMHRRFGKTVGCINELLTRALATKKENARYAYVAPYYSQAKAIAWDYLKRYGEQVIVKISEADLSVDLINGARIRLYGADNPDSLRGLYLDGVVLDEYADMRPSVWGAIIRPMLADRKGWAVFIGTPKGHNAFYDIYALAKRLPDDWFSLICRSSDSGVLPEDELLDARKSMSDDQYEQEFECSFDAAILGAVYGKWMADVEKDNRITKGLYDPSLPVHTAWDLGFDDFTFIWFWQIVRNEIRLINCLSDNGQDMAYYCDLLTKKKLEFKYKYGKHFVPHDAAHKLMAAGGRSMVEQAYGAGYKTIVIPATSQQNGINCARTAIKISWFDEDCLDGIESLKQYQFQYDEDKKIFKNKPRHDWTSHACDAYEIIGQVWQNPKQLEDEEKPKFLNDMTFNDLIKTTTKQQTNTRI